jgi:hypothetical protein
MLSDLEIKLFQDAKKQSQKHGERFETEKRGFPGRSLGSWANRILPN